jgi:hypothetical protein
MAKQLRESWDDGKDYTLCEAVWGLWDKYERLKAGSHGKAEFWWMVAGALLGHGIETTGPGVAKRWGHRKDWFFLQMKARHEEEEAMRADLAKWDDVWQEIEVKAEAVDRDMQEATLDAAEETLRLVRLLCKEWGVEA